MLTDTLKKLFKRDLQKLIAEINAYQKEETLWKLENDISNSAGNLCLHLVGNLHHFIGSQLGKTGYVRNRPLEFSLKGVSRATLIQQVEETIQMIETTLDQLSSEQLQAEYPLLVFKEKTSVEYMLVHLTTHLAYHLGQINYHRRLLDDPLS